MRSKVVVWGVALTALAASTYASWTYVLRPAIATQPVAVRVIVVKQVPFQHKVTAAGALTVAKEESLRAAFWSEGARLLVKEGDWVEAGQSLVELRAEDLGRTLLGYEVTLQSAILSEAQLARDATLQPERARQQLAEAQAELSEAKASLQTTLTRLGRQTEDARELLAQAERGAEAAGANYVELAGYLNELSVAREAFDLAKGVARREPNDSKVRANLARAERTYQQTLQAVQDLQARIDRQMKLAEEAVRSAGRDLAYLDPAENPGVANAQSSVQRAERSLAQVQLSLRANAVMPEEIAHAAAKVKQAEEDLKQFRSRWEQRVVRSPTTGLVIALPVKQGEPVQQGALLVTVGEVGRLTLNLRLDEGDLRWVSQEQEVKVRTTAYPGEEFTGSIQRVSPHATGDGNKGAAQFTVEALVPNTDYRLRPGMSVQGEIVTLIQEQAFVVPLTAIQEQAGQTYVWVVREGRVRWIQVAVGAQSRGWVTVDQGITGGEQVVVGPPAALLGLQTGVPVRVEATTESGGT